MSSRRLQEDYRRILGITEDVRGIDPALPRMRIAGTRGIYQQGDGTTKSGASPSEDADPVTPDETDTNLNEDGSGQGDQNTGDGVGGGGSAEDGSDFIIDPEDPTAGADVNSDTFGSNWASGGVKSFVDCETEQCIELVEVGGYVPPEGWDDADTPPVDNDGTFRAGWYYRAGSLPTTTRGATADIAIKRRVESGTTKVVSYPPLPTCFGGETPCTTDGNIQVSVLITQPGGNVVNGSVFIPVAYIQCSAGTVNSQSGCGIINDESELPPISDYWPSDNCIQLAPNEQGNWQASSMENPDDMTAKYSEPKSTLELCTPSGERVDVFKRIGGGHVYFNRDQGIWAGSDSSGRVRSFGSSSTLDQEIARPRN